MEEQTVVEKIIEMVSVYGLQLLAALAIFVIGKWVINILLKVMDRAMKKANVEDTLAKFIHNLCYFALLSFVIIAAVGKLGVQTTSFVAVIGAAGLAVGLALQGSLSNFAAGVLLILFKPFKLGDFIEAGGTLGSVQGIQIFNTVLAHPDNRKQIVPNSQILGGTITNFTAIERRRVDMVFGIGYDDDLLKAKNILIELVNSQEGVLKEPEPVVVVGELGDSSVNFNVRPWCKPADYWGVYCGMMERVKLRFDQEGISIPYPQQDVHIKAEGVQALAQATSQAAA